MLAFSKPSSWVRVTLDGLMGLTSDVRPKGGAPPCKRGTPVQQGLALYSRDIGMVSLLYRGTSLIKNTHRRSRSRRRGCSGVLREESSRGVARRVARSCAPQPRQALRTSIKRQFLKILITFGDKCPRNGSKNDLGTGFEGPGVAYRAPGSAAACSHAHTRAGAL
jgi:hypothetical protein